MDARTHTHTHTHTRMHTHNLLVRYRAVCITYIQGHSSHTAKSDITDM